MSKLRKFISIVLVLSLLAGTFVTASFTAGAASAVEYIERSWDSENKKVVSTTKTCTDYTSLQSRSSNNLSSGWYVVKSSFQISERLYVGNNTVNLILCDGVTLTANDGIGVSKNGTLNIYGQTSDTGKLYSHYDKGPYSEDIDKAVIGSDSGDAGTVRIYGGSLDIETGNTVDGYYGAAIGGGNGGSPAKIEIYGGNISSRTRGNGAAIGGGNGGKTSWNQSGDTGTAAGIVIYGGDVTAKGYYGAAIGSGTGCSGQDNGAIAIYGGEINAIESALSAGIGGGEYSANGPIDIYGGNVNASGVNSRYTGAGIGSGREADQTKPIRIHGGTVVATGGSGAGIGAGYKGNAGEISISGASIVASSTAGGAGIGGGKRDSSTGGYGGNITITDSMVVATSSEYAEAQAFKDTLNRCIGNSKMKTDASAFADSSVSLIALLVDLFDDNNSGTGIGAGADGDVGTITLTNSDITADSGKYAAAIGSGQEGEVGTINISGCTVTATSGEYAAAIGTGDEPDSGCTIHITNGSEIVANAGTDAAGIGTGNEADETADIHIADSNITAHGGRYGAGIGGGDAVSGGTIEIDNSTVEADSKTDGAGIGGGEGGDSGTITIKNSSNVTATGGGYAAGIGGGDDADGRDISIIGSTVKAYGGKDAAGIGGGEGGDGGNIKIDNAHVYAAGAGFGAGIGDGEDGDSTSIEINGERTTVEAVAGGDGEAAAIGHGGNGIFYSYHISRLYEDILACDAGSDKNHTSRYYGEDRYTATVNAKYAYFSVCEHNNTTWVYESEYLHLKQCTDCGMRRYATAGHHAWNENNVCTVCGASAVMREIAFVEQDSGGNSITSKVSGPVGGTIQAPASTHAPEGMAFVCWKEYDYYVGTGEPVGVSNRERTFEAVYLPVTQTTYIDSDGSEKTVTARRLTHTNLELTAGWYVVDSNIQSINTMTIAGDVKIILADGAVFSFYQGYSYYYDLDKMDCLVTARGMSSTLSVYGQTEQTGTLLIGNRHTVLTDFAQYGGIVNSQTGFFESTKNCVIEAGNFKTAVLACDRAAILGGNVFIGTLPLNKSLQLGWKQSDDSIHFDSLESEETSIVAGKAMQDESGNLYKEVLSAAQVEALAGKTLTAASEHQFGQPEWIWANDYCDATAVFRCEDCGEEVRVNAKVTVEDNDNIRNSTATCTLNGQTYIATHRTKLLWNITVAEPAHGTLSADMARARAGENVLVTATAAEGYKLDTLQVCDSEGRQIEVENNTFKMPESDVTVSASFALKTVNISVGGVKIHANNCSDILGDGTASYDFDTNTLTLTNADIEITNGFGIRYNESTNKPFNIDLEGENRIADDIDDGSLTCYGIVMFAAAPSFTIGGNGTLDIEMDSENPRIGIQARKTLKVERARVDINVTGSENAIGVDLVYNDSVLILDNAARLEIGAGGYALQSNRNVKNLNVGDNCFFEAISAMQAFHENINLTDDHPTVIVNTEPSAEGSDAWDNSTALTNYQYIKMRGEDAPLWVTIMEPEHGTVTSDLNRPFAFVSEYITLRATPDSGYELEGITVTDEEGNTISGKQNPFVFAMPLTDVTISVSFIPKKYTVTWKTGDTVLETDKNVPYGTPPTYDGATPADYEDGQTHYTFQGWSDGTNTFTADALPAVTKDVTYTAVYTGTEIQRHNNGASLTLNDGVSLNVYLDADSYGLDADKAVVKLTYNHNADVSKEQDIGTDIIPLSEATRYIKLGDPYSGTYKFPFKMAPAQFADDITIALYESADAAEAAFSATTNVKAKCDQVINLAQSNDTYASFATLCGALEDYCVASQVYFGYNAPETPAYNNDAVTTMDAADMEVPNTGIGIDVAGFSFTVVSGLEANVFYTGELELTGVSMNSTKGRDSVSAAVTAKGNKSCINIKGIASGNMDNLVTVTTTAGDVTLAATNIAKAIAASSNNINYVNLARALYLYSVQASSYFGC